MHRHGGPAHWRTGDPRLIVLGLFLPRQLTQHPPGTLLVRLQPGVRIASRGSQGSLTGCPPQHCHIAHPHPLVGRRSQSTEAAGQALCESGFCSGSSPQTKRRQIIDALVSSAAPPTPLIP
jgi:hypothetical protein